MLRLSLVVAVLMLFACWQTVAEPLASKTLANTADLDRDTVDLPRRIDTQHLPNAIRVTEEVISGGMPDGDEAFAELQAVGVKTIISVDGMKPDVDAAKKYGLRYVHLPHGYDGVPHGRVQELAKGISSLDGPIYVHCHHGKHRSPAATAVACIAAGKISPSAGRELLSLAGTSPAYQGLFEAVRLARPLDTTALQQLSVEFHETVDVPPMAQAMVAIEITFDRLKTIEAAGWQAPHEHPDLDPAHQALLLREHFTELLRVDSPQLRNDEFKRLMRASEDSADSLEEALRDQQTKPIEASRLSSLSDAVTRVEADCRACHSKFRDVPLGEK